MAALAGVGLASGRALALFFAQMKGASWAGILAASALFGTMVYCSSRRGAVSFSAPSALERTCAALRLLLASLTAACMLARLGEVGALTLPLRHSYAFGAAFGLLIAFALTRLRAKWPLGLLTVVYAGGFFAACAIDPRAARVHDLPYTDFTLAGHLPAALSFAAVYAALNACAADWVPKGMTMKRAELSIMSGATLGGLLCLANLALQRGGDAVIAHPKPWVVLSARWGLPGFWLCALFEAICEVGTLSAAFNVLLNTRRGRMAAVYAMAGGIVLFCELSYKWL